MIRHHTSATSPVSWPTLQIKLGLPLSEDAMWMEQCLQMNETLYNRASCQKAVTEHVPWAHAVTYWSHRYVNPGLLKKRIPLRNAWFVHMLGFNRRAPFNEPLSLSFMSLAGSTVQALCMCAFFVDMRLPPHRVMRLLGNGGMICPGDAKHITWCGQVFQPYPLHSQISRCTSAALLVAPTSRDSCIWPLVTHTNYGQAALSLKAGPCIAVSRFQEVTSLWTQSP